MPDGDSERLYHILNHVGEGRERHHGAVVTPTYQTSIFAADDVADMRRRLYDEANQPFYTRGHNPTVACLRAKLAALEGAQDALVFASGSGAVAAAVLAFVGAGDRIVCVQRPYTWTYKLTSRLLPRFGVNTVFVPGEDTAAMVDAIDESVRMVILESPNSLTFEEQDIEAIARRAHDCGALVMVDNSYATPLRQRPLEQGADLVVHSVTKYLNGHSDVVAGAVCGSDTLMARIFFGPFMTLGAIPSPHDASLILRGLRTLPLRLERATATAKEVVNFLESHPRVRRVYYPRRIGTGLLSFELDVEDVAAAERFCDALRCFMMTVSWGGFESLMFPGIAVVRDQHGALDDKWPLWRLVRLSIGLEPASMLIADLDQALAQI